VWQAFWAEGAGMFRHGYTYSGHAAASAAALANLDVIEREGLLARAMELEGELTEALTPLARHAMVSEVRSGAGVLAGVQLDPEVIASDPGLMGRVVPACRRQGIMTRALASGAIQVSPPLVLDGEGLAELAAGLEAALDDLEARR
jgi:putrescine---pyruvate transaminase